MNKLVPGAAKLVKIGTKQIKVVQTISFDDSAVLQGSSSPDDKTAYLTDSGAEGALILHDTASGSVRRVSDGIRRAALEPDITSRSY